MQNQTGDGGFWIFESSDLRQPELIAASAFPTSCVKCRSWTANFGDDLADALY